QPRSMPLFVFGSTTAPTRTRALDWSDRSPAGRFLVGDSPARKRKTPLLRGELVRDLRVSGVLKRWRKLAASGHAVAAIDFDRRSVYVWSMTSGAVVAETHSETQGVSPFLEFSADGRWLAADVGEEARLINTETWNRPRRSLAPF